MFQLTVLQIMNVKSKFRGIVLLISRVSQLVSTVIFQFLFRSMVLLWVIRVQGR